MDQSKPSYTGWTNHLLQDCEISFSEALPSCESVGSNQWPSPSLHIALHKGSPSKKIEHEWWERIFQIMMTNCFLSTVCQMRCMIYCYMRKHPSGDPTRVSRSRFCWTPPSISRGIILIIIIFYFIVDFSLFSSLACLTHDVVFIKPDVLVFGSLL